MTNEQYVIYVPTAGDFKKISSCCTANVDWEAALPSREAIDWETRVWCSNCQLPLKQHYMDGPSS